MGKEELTWLTNEAECFVFTEIDTQMCLAVLQYLMPLK